MNLEPSFARGHFVRSSAASLLLIFIAALGIAAQAKKPAKADTKKPATASKDAKKPDSRSSAKADKGTKADRGAKADKGKKDTGSRSSAKASSKDAKTSDRAKNDTRAKHNAANNARDKDRTERGSSKISAAERRRIDAERRQAAIEEQRRREQAAREARERRLAFERSFRNETIENITSDSTEGEDLEIRRAAINALGSRAGAVVVMEAQTGKVLTIVNQKWAVRQGIKPCSTIKLVTAVAALNENVIDRQSGSVNLASTRRQLDDALAFSDNPYFQRAGSFMGSRKMVEYARKLGLGEPTGINLEGETAGRVPNGNEDLKIYSHGDDFEVTPIQLAVMASAITNGGHRVLPRIPRNSIDNANFQPFYRANIDIPSQNLRRVIPGMMGAAEYGTARRGMDQNLGVAGKTGSCSSGGTKAGLFVSVAPIEQPKYSVVVITRGPGERGRNAAAVAAELYRTLGRGIVRTDRNLAQTEFNLRPRDAASTAAMAKAADRADDDDDDEAAAAGQPKVIVVRSAAEVNSVPTNIRKTSDAKPVNPAVTVPPSADPATKKRERIVTIPQE